MTVWPSCLRPAFMAVSFRHPRISWVACCRGSCLLRYLWAWGMLPFPSLFLCTGTWNLLCILCCIFSQGKGGQATTKTGLIGHLLRATILCGSLALMWRLMPSSATCRAVEVLPAGLTLPLRVALSWSSVALLARHGVLPGGMPVPGPRVMGPVLSGPRHTSGACLTLMQVNVSRWHLAMPSCAL